MYLSLNNWLNALQSIIEISGLYFTQTNNIDKMQKNRIYHLANPSLVTHINVTSEWTREGARVSDHSHHQTHTRFTIHMYINIFLCPLPFCYQIYLCTRLFLFHCLWKSQTDKSRFSYKHIPLIGLISFSLRSRRVYCENHCRGLYLFTDYRNRRSIPASYYIFNIYLYIYNYTYCIFVIYVRHTR